MTEPKVATSAIPIWVDISAKDPKAVQEFYSGLFSWQVQDLGPDAGGYAFFTSGGRVVAGVGPTQMDQQPTAWSIYIGTDDAAGVAKKVTAAGGTVVVPPFDVMGQGQMGVFQDPAGAFISVWQPGQMTGFNVHGEPGTFDWAELTARGLEQTKPFYRDVFGWDVTASPMGDGGMQYNEWQLGGKSTAGAMEMPDMVPAAVPSYWMPYFKTDDIAAIHRRAVELGGTSMMEPTPFPGGRFAVLSDSQGAAFGLTGA